MFLNECCVINLFKMFLCLRFNDPLFLRQKKVQILTTIASESNVEEIVTEMRYFVAWAPRCMA